MEQYVRTHKAHSSSMPRWQSLDLADDWLAERLETRETGTLARIPTAPPDLNQFAPISTPVKLNYSRWLERSAPATGRLARYRNRVFA